MVDATLVRLRPSPDSSAGPSIPEPSPWRERLQTVAARHSFRIACAVVLVLAIFQNFFRLGTAPLMPNEDLYARMGWSYVHWGSLSAGQRAPSMSNFEHPPLAKLLFGLAELTVGHPSVVAARAVDASLVIGTAALLAAWLGAVLTRWIGLFAGALYALSPAPIFVDITRFGRTASLDTVCQFFMVAALVLGWRWTRSTGRAAWLYAVATGACMGLATASKENGLLGILGPLVLSLFWSRTGWARLARWCSQVAALLLTAVAVFLATYLPFGDVTARLAYLFRFQTYQSSNGHLVGFAGRVSLHPPWWANFWFAGHSLGPPLAMMLAATALIAILVRRDSFVAWLSVSLIAPIAFHCFFAGAALPYYWVLWAPAVIALSAAGWHEMTLWLRSSRPLAAFARVALTAAVLAAVVPCAAELWRVATLHPVGAAVAGQIRAERNLRGTVLTTGTFPQETNPLLPGATVVEAVPVDLSGIDMLVIGQPRCRVVRSRIVRALIATNLATGAVRLVHSDRLVKVYLVDGVLTQPSAEQVDAQPDEQLAAHC